MKNYFERILMAPTPFFVKKKIAKLTPLIPDPLIPSSFFAFFVACFVLLIGWMTFSPAWAAEIKVKDYGVEVAKSKIYWSDKQNVIFLKLEPVREGQLPTQAGNKVMRLARMDTETGQSELGELVSGRLCVNGRHILQTDSNTEHVDHDRIRGIQTEPRFWILQGEWGNLTRQEVTREQLLYGIDYDFTCKPHGELPPLPGWMEAAQKEGRLFKRLRPEHGWVELGSSQAKGGTWPKQYPIRLYRPGTNEAEGIEIRGVEGKDLIIWTYSPFKNAYWLVERAPAGPSKEGVDTGWWLHPDGWLEIAYQYDQRDTYDGIRTWGPLIYVRDGFLAAEWPYPKAKRSPGLYWFDPKGKHRLLVAGELGAWAVSPDGCKLAFGNESRLNGKGMAQTRLQVIDTCLGK